MLGNKKIFGRCRVSGHGTWCEVSQDIQHTPITKSSERQKAKKEIVCAIINM